jgi:FMN phosphatase YigB (HAD superfamily)
MAVKVVFFDVGETLVDEARLWRGWAAWLGVPADAFTAALGETIAAGEPHRQVFERFRPGFDIGAARRERAAAGDPDLFTEGDLYPDAAPCLAALRERGFTVGIAGNQAAGAEAALEALGLPADLVTSSARLGAEKPAPAFFAGLAAMAGVAPEKIAYVGDRLDTDVLPARAAGMIAAFLARGPWGRAHALRPEAQLARLRLASLAELPDAIAGLR